MIRIISVNDNGKITKINYENNGFSKVIEPRVLTVYKDDDANIGSILEHYRTLNDGASSYFENNQSTIENFINKYSTSFENFTPDCIFCFFPSDINRYQLLMNFRNKITENYSNRDEIDFSSTFVKIDPLKSIKKDSLTNVDFELNIEKQTPIKNLLIIDDVIDEGKTVDILLDKLLNKKLINDDTVINMTFIYNRPKQIKTKINPLQAYKYLQNDRSNNNDETIR
jgi:hypothetical protein